VRRFLLAMLCAFGAGGLFALACPPYDYWTLAWAVPGLLLVPALQARPYQRYLCGVVYAVTIGSLITSWAPHAASAYFEYRPWLSRLFILGVHVTNPGIPCGLMVLLYATATRRGTPVTRAFIGAVLWVASEWLRTWSLGWELLGHSQHANLRFIQIAELGGQYAVSFVMAWCSLTLAEMMARPAPRRRAWALAPLAAVAASLLFGTQRLASYERSERAASGAPTQTVAVIQGSIPNQFRWKRAFFGRAIATYASLTHAVEDRKPHLIVWPENAVSFFLNRETMLRGQLAPVAAAASGGLLIGAPRRGEGWDAFNSAYLLSPDGVTSAVYDKRRLLPFGEYDPLPWHRQAPTEPTYVAGDGARLLETAALHIGPLICFEVLYPGLVRDLVEQGADVLVNISNDSWMDPGDGRAPRQHFSMAIFRAVETRRYLVRASSSGVSGFVSPVGQIFSTIATGETGARLGAVRPATERTLYVRWGDAWIVVALLGALALWARARRFESE